MSSIDKDFMRNALAVARRGLGQTWPNPSVGAVIVKPGDFPEVIARGWTGKGGRPHAERYALDRLDGKAEGCSLYVTLEPCSHHGRTPPCTTAIIKSGITRVVCGAQDPDPRVSGQGFELLEQAGIAVTRNVLRDECLMAVQGHILRVTENRPYVQLKLATGSDGRVPRGQGKPVWATGEQARLHGHLLRAQADAILVGSGTVAADDPDLTCRLPGMAAWSPVRVIMSRNGGIDQDARIIKSAMPVPVWLVVSANKPDEVSLKYSGTGVETVPVPVTGDAQALLDPRAVLGALAGRGITRLLIEGGPGVSASFMDHGLVDEIVHYTGPEPVGVQGIVPFGGLGLEVVNDGGRYTLAGEARIGGDTLRRYIRK